MKGSWQEKLKEIWSKAKESVGKVSKKIWIITAVSIVLVAVAIVAYLYLRPYAVLVTGSNMDELSTVLTWLDGQGYHNYRLEGNTISVPKGQATTLKTRLLTEVINQPGASYSLYFDNISALSTQGERDYAKQLALQEQLSDVIRGMDGIRDATVIITPGSDNNYILDSSKKVDATASVKVTMATGRSMTSTMAEGIRYLVSHAVEGVAMESVAIIDDKGNTFNISGDTTATNASRLKMELEEAQANKIRTQILEVLEPIYGPGNIRVAVNCVVEVSTSTINDHRVYLPPYAQDGSTLGAGIIGSIIWNGQFQLNEDGTVGGVVGTESNADIPMIVEKLFDADGNFKGYALSGQADMDNSFTDTNTLRSAAYISDCSVAVTINSTTAGVINQEQVRGHVASAANITAVGETQAERQTFLEGKISILAQPFYVEPTPDPVPSGNFFGDVPNWVIYAAAGGVLLFLILLIVILILSRKRRKKKQKEQEEALAVEQALAAAAGIAAAEPMGADVMSLQSERSMELRKDIRKFAEENPEVAAQLVRTWLRGGDDDG